MTGQIAGGRTLNGVLASRSPEPDYGTGLYTLTFLFPNIDPANLGRFVAVELPVDVVRGIFISQSSLVRRYGRYFVWEVGDDSTIKTVSVVNGPMYGDSVLIKEGLTVGDRFVLRPTGREKEGDSIEVAER